MHGENDIGRNGKELKYFDANTKVVECICQIDFYNGRRTTQ